MNEDKIEKLVDAEWEMFTTVHNIGGRAYCQDDRRTFDIMRGSQFSAWGDDAVESYYNDVMEAKEQGRNLVAEKYGYMMKETDPENFENIKDMLPEVTDEKKAIIDSILANQLAWTEDFETRYPWISHFGRPVEVNVKDGKTSMLTYARGEYSTYSLNTLKLLKNRFETYKNNGINLAERIVEAEMKAYGYSSLDDAEETLKNFKPIK
ncbi:MAG: DUF4125 family protein [Eubacteriales bacterium]|nr:DUF4125 family protein [Eubacteriales bacterium]